MRHRFGFEIIEPLEDGGSSAQLSNQMVAVDKPLPAYLTGS
jgi:hypothetical protein